MKAKLILVAGKADKGEVRLKLPTIIGRTRDAGLMIAHKTVSRRHCELFERHGMLYVRDSGSLNGTLVDDAPVKESMLKPGHTVTVGPLTFRAEYEPADSFLGGDEPSETISEPLVPNPPSASDSKRTAAIPTVNGSFEGDHVAEADPFADFEASGGLQEGASPSGAAEEVLDFGAEEPADDLALDFGGDETLSMQISEETTDIGVAESPLDAPALESAEFDASEFTESNPLAAELDDLTPGDGPATVENDFDAAFSLDEVDVESTEPVHVESSDDLALDFAEMTDGAPAAEAAPAADDFDLDVADDEPALTASAPAEIDDLIPAGGETDDLSFDFLADDAPAAGAPAESSAADGDGDEFSLAEDAGDLDFGSPEPAKAVASDDDFDLGEDDGGVFNLADDQSAAAKSEAAPAAAEGDPLDFGSDEEVSFDLAEPAEETPPAKGDAKPVAAKKKPADDDDEMADFLKELGM